MYGLNDSSGGHADLEYVSLKIIIVMKKLTVSSYK